MTGDALYAHGPIPAAVARALAFDPTGTWRRLLTDEPGQVVDAGRTVYKPPPPLERLIRTRDVTCRFPTCRRAAVRSEIDHIIAWLDDGPTDRAHLQALCPRHHHLQARVGSDRPTTPRRHHPLAITSRPHLRQPPDELPRDTTTDSPDHAGQAA